MKLNEKLAMLRNNNGYSTRELAGKLDVSQSSISLWEKGERKPDYENIVKLAKLYSVSTDFLLGSQTLGVKSKLNLLNEQRNLIASQINMVQMEIKQLNTQIELYQKELQVNSRYRDGLEQKNRYANESNDINYLDAKILELVNEKTNNLEMREEESHKKLMICYKHLQELSKQREKLGFQCTKEENKVNHIIKNFTSIDSQSFKNIDIQSEYELQVIILKYLDLYNSLERSYLDIDEFMNKLKTHVRSNFWSI